MRRGLVLGCGGTVGGAWQLGALAAVRDALDWAPETANVIVGTSAGAHVAAMLGAGYRVDQLIAAERDDPSAPDGLRAFLAHPPAGRPRAPRGRPPLRLAAAGVRTRNRVLAMAAFAPRGRTDPHFLDDLAHALSPSGAWVDHPGVRLIAVDIGTGDRVAFGAPDAPRANLSEALRASWAVPGWYPPVEIGGRTYIDGGAASTCSADLALEVELDEVVVVAPMASHSTERIPGTLGRVEGVVRASMTRRLDAELALLRERGVRVLRVHPSRDELAIMGANFMDPRQRLAALDGALAHVPSQLANATDQRKESSA